MAISCLDEAKAYVAKHQSINLTEHRYYVVDPFDTTLTHHAKTSGELVLRVARSYAEHYQTTWRRRILGDEFRD